MFLEFRMEARDVSWNAGLELLMCEEGEKALGLSWLHTRCESYFGYRNNWISIPCIILSTLAGSASVGSQSIFEDARISSLAIGSVSLLVGMLNTINSYFSWAKRTEAHRIAHIQYAKLHRFICVEMSLPRDERIAAKDMLKVVREQVERLAETSPAVPEHIVQAFNKRLGNKYPDVAKPDVTNGLKKVLVHRTKSNEVFSAVNPMTNPQH